ncbi:MAG: baeRF10 domain-containing protein [Gemmatimonadales bacterium]|jgi:peptide chain release factor subunit 1
MAVIESRSSSDGRRTAQRGTNGRGAARAAAPAITERLEGLTSVAPAPHRVVSCYLKLEPRDRSRNKYLIKIKNRMRAAAQALPRLELDRQVQEEVTRDLERVHRYLRNPANLPSTQGLAIFACEAIGLFEALPLPVVYRSRLGVDATPLVRELASVEEEFGRLLTVVLDRTSARFFEVTAYETRELPGLRADSTRGKRFRGDQSGPGWGEHTYNNRIRTEKQRHYEAVARELFTLDRRQPAHGLVVAGTGAEAGALEPFLHTYLLERLLGTARLNPKEATAAAVHAATLGVREAWERESERAQVREMQEALGGGWSVNGLDATLRALSRGQVRTLLVHADAAEPGFRCGTSGRLARTERECREEGEPMPVLDIVDDAIEEALRQGVDVNVVYDPEARAALDGAAGLLRFR